MDLRVIASVTIACLLCACDGQLEHRRAQQDDAPVVDMRDDVSPRPGVDLGGTTSNHSTPVVDMGGRDAADMQSVSEEDMSSPDEPSEAHPNKLDQDMLFVCHGVPGTTPARIRRIDNIEYARSIHHDNGKLVPFLPHPDDRYSTYTSNETIDASILREFLRQNHIPGGTWAPPNNNGGPRLKILRGADSIADQIKCFQNTWQGVPAQDEPTPECTRQFVTAILEHGVYMRPPNPGEVDRLVAFADAQIQKELADDTIDRDATITTIMRAAWLTRGALFHDELGSGRDLGDGRRRLDDREIAQALSLAIGDDVAGVSKSGYVNEEGEDNRRLQTLHEAALAGVLDDPDTIEAIVRDQLAGAAPALADPGRHPSTYPVSSGSYIDQYWMSTKLRGFFREWLDYADAESIFKDTPEATSRYDDGMLFRENYPSENDSTYRVRNRQRHDLGFRNAAIIDHLDNMIARIVASDQDVLAKLLTTRQFIIPPASGSPYAGALFNMNQLESGYVEELPDRWVELPDAERAGVLTHPAWLSAHGGNFENDPAIIYRGKWIREELLCGFLPDIPLDVDAQLDPTTRDHSARSRVSAATEGDAFCSSCHNLMNPLGYPFEIYNHAGFVRAHDHGAPPDGSAVLRYLPRDPVLQDDMRVRDAVDMMEKFSRSPRVKRCFIRQSFRYFMGRDETVADACTLEQMEAAYDQSGGSMIQMLVALFQSDTFLTRSYDTEE